MIIGDETQQKARKEHDCWWCGELIDKGDRYFRWLWKDGNDLVPIKTHPECREFARGCLCEHDQCKCELSEVPKA